MPIDIRPVNVIELRDMTEGCGRTEEMVGF